MYEAEIKISIPSAQEMASRCLAMGAVPHAVRVFEDNFVYDFADRRLKLEGKLLRLRRFGDDWILTFKGPADYDQGIKIRQEIETRLLQPADWQAILDGLGMKCFFRYQKYRSIYQLELPPPAVAAPEHQAEKGHPLHAMIDETPIGAFLELEGPPHRLRQLAASWELPSHLFLTQTYYDLFLEARANGFPREHLIFSE